MTRDKHDNVQAAQPVVGPVVIRRYKPGKDAGWFRQLPGEALVHMPVSGAAVSSWVVQVNDRPVGIGTWTWQDPLESGTGEIVRFWFMPGYRRRGYGTKLYRRLVSEMRKLYRKASVPMTQVKVVCRSEDVSGWSGFWSSLKFEVDSDPFCRHQP